MNGYKSLLSSKTFWGAVIALLAALFPGHVAEVFSLFGVTDQMMLAAKVIAFVGVAVAIYGRAVATKKLTLTGKPPSGEPLTKY
jgi:hypothetical protein